MCFIYCIISGYRFYTFQIIFIFFHGDIGVFHESIHFTEHVTFNFELFRPYGRVIVINVSFEFVFENANKLKLL